MKNKIPDAPKKIKYVYIGSVVIISSPDLNYVPLDDETIEDFNDRILDNEEVEKNKESIR
jgi:hypothetical protein